MREALPARGCRLARQPRDSILSTRDVGPERGRHCSDAQLSRLDEWLKDSDVNEGDAHPIKRELEANQQLGLTRQRDWAGRTGKAGHSKAGHSKAGQRLAILFSIGVPLSYCSIMNRRRKRPSRREFGAL